MELLLVVLMGLLDRVRGGWAPLKKVPGLVKAQLYGACVALLLGIDTFWMVAAAALLFAIGETFGWGTPLATALGEPRTDWERWQIGKLRENVWLALVVRGAMWGAPVALLTFFEPTAIYALPAFAIAMPLAPAILRASVKWKPCPEKWAQMELIRGWVAGLIILILMKGF